MSLFRNPTVSECLLELDDHTISFSSLILIAAVGLMSDDPFYLEQKVGAPKIIYRRP